jgi:hypothetical protein
MSRRKDTVMVKASLEMEDALLLDILQEKKQKSKGIILQEFLLDSPKWQELKKKVKDFKDDF